MQKIEIKLFLLLFTAFIIATVFGTVSHEFGHYLAAKMLGYNARINYGSTFWYPKYPGEVINAKDAFLFTLGGPVQTMLTGTLGLILLMIFYKSFNSGGHLNFTQWVIIFLSLFWLRQLANLVTWIMHYISSGHFSYRADEIRLALYLQIPFWIIMTITAMIGLIVLLLVIFKIIPSKQRLTFITAGFTGGITGYFLWLVLFGKYLMP